jgi:hypothetical protein
VWKRNSLFFMVLLLSVFSAFAQTDGNGEEDNVYPAAPPVESVPDEVIVDDEKFNSNTEPGQIDYESRQPDGKKLNDEALKDRTATLDYTEIKKEKKPEEQKNRRNLDLGEPSFGAASEGLKSLAYVLAFVLLVAIVVYLFYKSGTLQTVNKKSKPLAGLAEWEDAWSMDVDALDIELQNAVEAADYRMAIRLLYLRNLRLLMDRGIVAPSPEKTNAQYLAELKKALLLQPFRFCTGVYETVWYGEAKPDYGQYKAVLPGFQELYDKARKN